MFATLVLAGTAAAFIWGLRKAGEYVDVTHGFRLPPGPPEPPRGDVCRRDAPARELDAWAYHAADQYGVTVLTPQWLARYGAHSLSKLAPVRIRQVRPRLWAVMVQSDVLGWAGGSVHDAIAIGERHARLLRSTKALPLDHPDAPHTSRPSR